jgi:hypothetical protein
MMLHTLGRCLRRLAEHPTLGLLLTLSLTACAMLPTLIPPALEFAQSLLKTSNDNYSPGYNEDLKALLLAMARPSLPAASSSPTVAIAAPAAVPAPAPITMAPPPQRTQVQGMGSSQAQSTAPFALDLALLRKDMVNGRPMPVAIQDGDILRDGRGDPQAGDKFKIVFRPASDGYVYVIAIDGSGWAQGLFPSKHSTFSNPVSRGREYVLPEGPFWYSLDQFRGVETIYLVASYRPRPDIEEVLSKIAGRERSPLATPQQVQQAPVVPNGFAGSSPGQSAAIQSESGETRPVNLTTFFSGQAGDDLRITRWFRHE